MDFRAKIEKRTVGPREWFVLVQIKKAGFSAGLPLGTTIEINIVRN